MFELSIAWKYLLPKKRQLSVSIISLISILVISLVIWLILVFFSVSRGLEKGWIEKLTALTSPVRVTPTEAYYNSYYFQVDKLSEKAGYSAKTLGEKLKSKMTDPYDPEMDEALPSTFPKPDLDSHSHVKDLVKLTHDAIQSIQDVPGLSVEEFTLASASLRIRLLRGLEAGSAPTQAFLTHSVYVGSQDMSHPSFQKTLLEGSSLDHKNRDEIALVMQDETHPDEPNGPRRLPKKQKETGEAIYVPKGFREAGVLEGDRGFLSYYAPTASAMQEQRTPVYVAGFYDPGIVPLGGKFILTSDDLVKTIRAAQQQEASSFSNGFNIRLTNLDQADAVKNSLIAKLDAQGLLPYWKVETFREFDYAKDLLQQLNSEKHIFGLISLVILTVACSNIISMLIILVNNKRQEIGILRSMGASSFSIAAIFGVCGMLMGFAGTIVGALLALFTLRHLNELLGLISALQGFDAFNPLFYGDALPNEMSWEVLGSVLISTILISLLAGLIPALKAARVQPAEILRAEG